MIADRIPALAGAGFDGIQMPPLSKAQGGAGAGCDGDGVYDLRDLGSKPQQGSTPTRYGTIDMARRAFAVAHSYGMSVLVDIILHQNDGAPYKYLGADTKTLNGRGALGPGCFRKGGYGTQPQDAVPSPGDDSAFGDEKVYQNSNPANFTMDDALDWGNWMFRTLGADGSRWDDAKGIWAPFVRRFMDHGSMATLPFYAEFFDGNPANLAGWALSDPMSGRSGVTDFNAHFAIADACNSYSAYPLAQLHFAAEYPGLSYMFIDNPDTDTSAGEGVISNKLLGYARALTVPCRQVLIYGKDYFGPDVWPGSYELGKWIDNLVYVNRTYAYGAETIRYVDNQLFIAERDGNGGAIGQSAGLLTAINFDIFNPRAEWVPTSFGANIHLHDVTGHGPDIWTNQDGWAYVGAPSNAYSSGQSYCCYVVAGEDKPVSWQSGMTTQYLYGADDLDIGPATPLYRTIAYIHAKGRTTVTFTVVSGAVSAQLVSADGQVIERNIPESNGRYGVQVRGALSSTTDFELGVTYRGV